MRAWTDRGGVRTGAGCVTAIIVAAPLGGCQMGVLDAQGPVALSERLLLLDATAIMLSVVLPVIALTLAFAYWFRASNSRASYTPEWAYSGRIEVVVWSIPAMIVLLLGGIGWISAHDLDPYRPLDSPVKPLQVQVVSLDWKWLFIYPEQGIAAVNRLVVPAGVPLAFHLTSATVMNSFFVPQLGSQIYTMGGMTTQLALLADKPGDYAGLSAQFSGNGFASMHFIVHAVAPDAFQGWVAGVRGSGPALDMAGYAALARASSSVAPATYRSVAPHLFEQILARTAPGAEGPQLGSPSPAASMLPEKP